MTEFSFASLLSKSYHCSEQSPQALCLQQLISIVPIHGGALRPHCSILNKATLSFPTLTSMWILFFLFCSFHTYDAICPPGTFQGLSNTDCYFVSTDTASWYDAEKACVKKSGHLASVSSQLTNSFLMQFTQECASAYWLGGTWTYRNGWIWSDGQRFQYTDWADGKS